MSRHRQRSMGRETHGARLDYTDGKMGFCFGCSHSAATCALRYIALQDRQINSPNPLHHGFSLIEHGDNHIQHSNIKRLVVLGDESYSDVIKLFDNVGRGHHRATKYSTREGTASCNYIQQEGGNGNMQLNNKREGRRTFVVAV